MCMYLEMHYMELSKYMRRLTHKMELPNPSAIVIPLQLCTKHNDKNDNDIELFTSNTITLLQQPDNNANITFHTSLPTALTNEKKKMLFKETTSIIDHFVK